MKRRAIVRLGVVGLAGLLAGAAAAGVVEVRDWEELRAALAQVGPGATLRLAPGEYRGGLHLVGLAGTATAPITLCAADPARPPLFTGGGGTALQFSDCNHVTLRDLRVRGYPANGVNIDDGGSYATPSRHILVENVTIEATGPEGNHDALKLSGLEHFTIRGSLFRGWGGSGIDMVGCRHGLIEDCTFVGLAGFSQANAIQMKGGTRAVRVRRCLFMHAGQRAINLGGSTGPAYFRPTVGDFEAREIEVAGNRFLGGQAAVAWVTAVGGHVHHNTIVFPEKWVLRILQETSDERFLPCQGGIFEHNLIVLDRRVGPVVNVGPRTRPESFVFRRNAWFQTDGQARPALPGVEEGGVYQVDPEMDFETLRATSRDARLMGMGADHYRP